MFNWWSEMRILLIFSFITSCRDRLSQAARDIQFYKWKEILEMIQWYKLTLAGFSLSGIFWHKNTIKTYEEIHHCINNSHLLCSEISHIFEASVNRCDFTFFIFIIFFIYLFCRNLTAWFLWRDWRVMMMH